MTAATGDDRETVLGDLELTRGLAIQMSALGTLGFVAAAAGFSALFQAVAGHPASFQFAPAGVAWWTDALNLLVLAVLATAFVVPHELLHGLAIRYYGGRARYGVGVAHFILPYAYATTDHEFSRNQFIVVLLTPLVVLTAVGVPAMLALDWGWLIVPLAANAAGAVADLWMTLTLLGYPAHVRLEDHATGVRILGRPADRPGSLSVTALVWDALSGAAVAAVGALFLLAVAGPFVLTSLGVGSFTVGTPGTLTHLFSFVNRPYEISLTIGPGVLALGAAAGVAYAFARSYRRRGRASDAAAADAPADR
ncbi:DUF3267 domain-containing protein [Halostella litorea]|uniref:DUF3267 domain-containing protein n=1 Tax=Halostella litorea TaxID=2528831 RepID=UPI001092A4B3|nr:DUF3267 domain-containing protein [Halostella litorea]